MDNKNGSIMNDLPVKGSSLPADMTRPARTSSLLMSQPNAARVNNNKDNPSHLQGNLVVERPVYTEKTFADDHQLADRRGRPLKERVRRVAKSTCTCSLRDVKKFMLARLPVIGIMKNYQVKEWLASDITSGLTVGIMHIPQGMAYALLTTLPAYYGLYVSFFPVLLYFFLGTSRHISIGTFAVVSLMVGGAVEKQMSGFHPTIPPNSTFVNGTNTTSGGGGPSVADQEVEYRVKVALAVTLVAGLIQIAMGVLRLGFLTIYLSDPLTSGFTTGAACHVFTSQVKYFFNLSVKRYSGAFKLIYTYIDLFKKIPQTELAAVIISAICIVILVIFKELINPRVKPKIKTDLPSELLVIIGGTVASYFGKFNKNYNLNIVGKIPTGFPAPRLPDPEFMGKTAPDAVAIAIVAFAISVSMVMLFAKRYNYEANSNQELFAYGICNCFGSFFNCFMSCASLSRSLIQVDVGGKTQLAGVISSVLVLIVILAIGPLFEALPKCVLASIIVVALKGMFKQFKELYRLWGITKVDFLIWLVAFLGTVVLDVDIGLLVGIGFSLLTVIYRTSRANSSVLGRVPHTDIYKNLKIYKSAKEIEGIKIFRYEASMYYANKEHFRDLLYKLCNPRQISIAREKINKKWKAAVKKVNKEEKQRIKKLEKLGEMTTMGEKNVVANKEVVDMESGLQKPEMPSPAYHHIIIDCSMMGYIDSAGVKLLTQILDEYKEVQVDVFLSNCKANVRQMLQKSGFFKKNDVNQMFISTHDAVLAALEKNEPALLELQNDPIPPVCRGLSFSEDNPEDGDINPHDMQQVLLQSLIDLERSDSN